MAIPFSTNKPTAPLVKVLLPRENGTGAGDTPSDCSLIFVVPSVPVMLFPVIVEGIPLTRIPVSVNPSMVEVVVEKRSGGDPTATIPLVKGMGPGVTVTPLITPLASL